jgi:SAM-dependent methyltransferase
MDPSALFHSLSDPTRLRLLRLLHRQELNVQEMVRVTGLSQPRISKHLSILRDQGWLQQRREGTYNWYRTVGPADFAPGEGFFRQALTAADSVAQAEADDGALQGVLADRQARERDFFAGLAHRWDHIRQEYEHPDIRLGILGAMVDPSLRVLDIGTGTGAMLPVFSGAAGLTVALDNSEAMLERADELCRRDCLENIHLCRADVRELPFAGASFDAVNCAMVLQHVEDPQAALHEMGRVLRPGGPLVVTGFRPHDQQWMREELGHRWLGFERHELEEHFREAGLTAGMYLVRGKITAQDAPPRKITPGGGNLEWPDVFLAVGRKPRQA